MQVTEASPMDGSLGTAVRRYSRPFGAGLAAWPVCAAIFCQTSLEAKGRS